MQGQAQECWDQPVRLGALGQGSDLQGTAGDAEADSGFPLSWANLSLPLGKGAGVTRSGILELKVRQAQGAATTPPPSSPPWFFQLDGPGPGSERPFHTGR